MSSSDKTEWLRGPSDSPPTGNHPWLAILLGIVYLLVLVPLCFCIPGMLLAAVNVAVLLHTFSHFLAARATGAGPVTLSMGFGPQIPGLWHRSGQTLWTVSVIPLGSYLRVENETTLPKWKRFAVTGAGVGANAICALGLFMVVGFHGEEHTAAVIGKVNPGSPAWRVGMRSGDVIQRIGDHDILNWTEMSREIVYGADRLSMTFGPPGDAPTTRVIESVFNPESGKPVIGVGLPSEPVLWSAGFGHAPYGAISAAAKATPSFQPGDRIIGTTDPDDPASVLPLMSNQHNPQSAERDYFDLHQRLKRLQGKAITLQVERSTGVVDIQIPPAFHRGFGLQMKMGPIVAVRLGPEAQLGLVLAGDIIESVEVTEPDGRRLRWGNIDAGAPETPGVTDKQLDPIRLPFELERWALRRKDANGVKLTLQRIGDDRPVTVELQWDDRFRYSIEMPLGLPSPVSIGGLGIAYSIDRTVAAVAPDSPATQARQDRETFSLEPGDVIVQVRSYEADLNGKPVKRLPPATIDVNQWAYVEVVVQTSDCKQFDFTVRRGDEFYEFTLDSEEDESWPVTDRGLRFQLDTRIERASNPVGAIALGGHRLAAWMTVNWDMVTAAMRQRLTTKQFVTPARLVETAQTRRGLEFFLFLGLTLFAGANALVAIANLFPIPGLDAFSLLRLLMTRGPSEDS